MTRLQRIVQRTRELLHFEQQQEPAPRPPVRPPVKPPPKRPVEHPRPPKPPVHFEGIDYSAGNGLTAAQIVKADKHFVCRYLSHDPSKDINKRELANLHKAGLAVVLVFETLAGEMKAGQGAGAQDAESADQKARALGLISLPIYFACDFDATEADQRAINAYLSGVAGIIGRRRTGIYAGFWPLKRAFDAGRVTYGWQTYAWSGGHWDGRAQIQQYQNGVRLGPAEVDLNRSTAIDYGQSPRPVI